MSMDPNHNDLAEFAGGIRHDIERARAKLRCGYVHEAIEVCEIAAGDLKCLETLLRDNQGLELLREIHAAWALANHVPSDAPGSWESQMMRKIEQVLGIDTAPNLGELDAMPAGARKHLLGDVLRRMGAAVNGAAA